MCLIWALSLSEINARTRLGELPYIVVSTLAQGQDSLDSNLISATCLLHFLLTAQCLSFPISKREIIKASDSWICYTFVNICKARRTPVGAQDIC